MEIPLPLRGKNTARAFADQPMFTASVCENVRGVGPDGRVRLCQRAGQGRYCAVQVGANVKIARLISTVFDSRRVTYSALADAVREWGADLQGSRRARAGCVDRQDNVYVVDGDHSVAKWNSDGRLVWTLKLPVVDDKHVVGTVDTDDQGNLYVAVSEGGDPDTAKVWRFRTKKVNRQPERVWEYIPGGFVTRLKQRGDVLYLAVNFPKSESSRIVQLQGALSSGPTVGWFQRASYPVNDLGLKANGDVLFCSPANPTRGIDLRSPAFTEKTLDQTLREIVPAYEKALWCDLDPAKIVGLEANDPVTLWEDSSGNRRDLFASSSTVNEDTSPVYQPEAINGLPSVLFRSGDSTLGTLDCLQSGVNPSAATTDADQQRTTVPAYQGAQWVMFMVLRPNLAGNTALPINQCVWSLSMFGDSSGAVGNLPGAEDMQLWVNRSTDVAGASAADASAGTSHAAISFVAQPTLARPGASSGNTAGTNFWPIHGYYDLASPPSELHQNDTGTILVTLVWDAGRSPDTDDGTVAHCTLRINGKPIDRWVGSKSISPGPFLLGKPYVTADAAVADARFGGHVGRIIVFRNNEEAANGLMEMPRYPRTVGPLLGAVPPGSVPVPWDVLSDTVLEKCEGALMHEYGISHLAPSRTAAARTASWTGYGYTLYDPGHYPHPYERLQGPPTEEEPSQPYRLNSPAPIVAKMDGSKGKLQWVATSAAYGSTATFGIGGIGYALAVHGDRIFCAGPPVAGGVWPDGGYAGNIAHVRCLIDKNTTGMDGFSVLGLDGGWADTIGGLFDDWEFDRLRLDVDPHANLYVPIAHSAGTDSLRVYAGAGTAGVSNLLVSVPTYADTFVALCQRNVPAYRIGDSTDNDFRTNTITDDDIPRAELVYALGGSDASYPEEVTQFRLVETTGSSGTPRQIVTLAFAGGNVSKITDTANVAPAGVGTLTQPVYTGHYVTGVPAFGKVYFADGRSYFKYDPKSDVVSKWTASDGGKIPPRCRLVELWNGRIVIARAYDDPHGWHMSAQGDPESWDFFPIPKTATMAVSSVSARAGSAPDIVNALIPYSDDLLVVGCEGSVWVMRGDPAVNGVFDQVSDSTGIAFGRAWCRDPEGTLYFFGSRGGVYRMSGAGTPESLTRDVIEQEMRGVDLATNYVELIWNEEDDSLEVHVMPFGAGGASVQGWTWQRKVDGWFPDTRADTDVQPTAVLALSGDTAGERALLYGSQDGYVRKWDRDAVNDGTLADGTVVPIAARVRWGPLAPKGTRKKYRFTHPTFVVDGGPVNVKLYANIEPTDQSDPVVKDSLSHGRNAALPMRVAGEYVWAELQSREALTRWAIEGGSIEAFELGRTHERSA